MSENDAENLVPLILKDIQARMGRLEERMANLELRMAAQEQHLGTLLLSLPSMIGSMR
jgi:hypothetical protein